MFSCSYRSSLNQLPVFQQQQNRAQNNQLQSTTLTTTSGLGSNFTSYTTDPIDSSLGSSNNSDHQLHNRKNDRENAMGAGNSSSFLESDLGTTEEYPMFIPDEEHANMNIQQRMMMNYEGGEMSTH